MVAEEVKTDTEVEEEVEVEKEIKQDTVSQKIRRMVRTDQEKVEYVQTNVEYGHSSVRAVLTSTVCCPWNLQSPRYSSNLIQRSGKGGEQGEGEGEKKRGKKGDRM